MSAFPVLEVAIGLSFTYLLLALIVSTLTEWISRFSNTRGRMLRTAVRQMVGEDGAEDPELTRALFGHPLIGAMGENRKRLPSYIPSDVFAKALKDVVAERRAKAQATQQRAAADSASGKGDAPPALPIMLEKSLAALRPVSAANLTAPGVKDLLPDDAEIQNWYDQSMERVSGWYKRHTQAVVLALSLALTLATNADSLRLAARLWTDSAIRSTAVEAAKVRLQQGPPLETVEYLDPTTPKPTQPVAPPQDSANQLLPEEQALLGDLLGWDGEGQKLAESQRQWGGAFGFALWVLPRLLGWLITALAISLGAPFWFDTLSRFMRAAGRAPEPARSASAGRG